VYVPGYWLNGSWNDLPSLDSSRASNVRSLVVLGSDVYAGGYSTNSSGVTVAGYWLNGSWNGLPPLDPSKHSVVVSLVVVE